MYYVIYLDILGTLWEGTSARTGKLGAPGAVCGMSTRTGNLGVPGTGTSARSGNLGVSVRVRPPAQLI